MINIHIAKFFQKIGKEKIVFYKDHHQDDFFISKGSSGLISNAKSVGTNVVEFDFQQKKLSFVLNCEEDEVQKIVAKSFGYHQLNSRLEPIGHFDSLSMIEKDSIVASVIFKIFPFYFERILKLLKSSGRVSLSSWKNIDNDFLDYYYFNMSKNNDGLHSVVNYSVVKRKRLSKTLEEVVLKNYTVSNEYSSNFDIHLNEDQQKEFLKDKTGSFTAKYLTDLMNRGLETPDFLHNYIVSLKAFGNLDKIKGRLASSNYFVEMYLKKINWDKKNQK